MLRIILALALMATIVSAQPRRQMMGNDDKAIGQMHRMEQLKLSEDQEKQVDKLRADMQKERIALRARIQSLRVDLREQHNADKPDRAKIESLISEIGKLQTEVKLKHSAFWFDVNKLLTADQQKIWKEHGGMKMPGGKMRMMEGRGMRGGRRMMEERGMMRHGGREMMDCGKCDGCR